MSTLIYTTSSMNLKPSDTLDNARSTVTRVDPDAGPSVADSIPEYNRLETDPHTEGGLTPHQVASRVKASEQYAPATESRGNHMESVNDSISRVGTAAQREAAGQWGHGTMRYQDSMTRPEDGTEFMETYFKRDTRSPNEYVGAYMTPTNEVDPETLEDVSNTGRAAMADRTVESPYNVMMRNLMNGVQ